MTTSDNERKLLRKINMAFVPLMMLIQFFQFSDRGTLANAVAMGIFQDTHMTHAEFSWASAIVFIGGLAFQLPNVYFLHKLPIAKYLGFTIVVWGIIQGCIALARDFSQLAALRFLLGMTEGAANPGLALVISTLYRRSEQPVVTGIMFFANSIATLVGGVISYGISQMDNLYGISAWKWCMILYGTATVLVGISCFFFMPDMAYSRWLRLTDQERLIMDARVRDNATVQTHTVKKKQIVEALCEPRLYCYTLAGFMIMTQNGCMVTFSTQIIVTMGYGKAASLLIAGARGISDAFYLAVGVYASSRWLGQCLTAMDLIKLAGIYLFSGALVPVMMLSSISNNIAGYTKKSTYLAFVITSFTLGNFCGPLMLVDGQKPQYVGGLAAYAAFQLVSALLFVYIRMAMKRENERRDRMESAAKLSLPPEHRETLDLTDMEDVHFRYRL